MAKRPIFRTLGTNGLWIFQEDQLDDFKHEDTVTDYRRSVSFFKTIEELQRHSLTSLETARSLANGNSWGGGGGRWGSMYSAFPGNGIAASPSSLLSIWGVWSLWAELNGGENSLHWKANMLPLFSIMTLCLQAMHIFSVEKSNPLSLQIFIGW